MADVVAENSPQTISSALEELEFKYTMPLEDIEPCIQFLSSSPPKGKCLQRLREIVLQKNNISELGDLQQVSKMLQNATVIDLSYNNLHDWSVVGNLLTAIPSLKQLDLSFNPMNSSVDNLIIPKDNRLEALMLSGIDLSLPMLARVLSALPQLKVLQVCYTSLEPPPDKENQGDYGNLTFDNLTDLYLNADDLKNWTACLQYAQKFPSLQKLHLSENEISEIFEKCEKTGFQLQEAMPNLNSLSLNTCSLTDWKSIEALGALTNLKHFRIREAPLFDKYDCETRHQLTIPRIPSLQTLNGSVISKEYRENCERFFIRYYQNRENKPLKIYGQLVDVHGNLEQLICLDLTPEKFVQTRLRCDECNINTIIRLRLNITMRAFINAIVKTTGIPLNRVRVLHTTPQYPSHSPTELRISNQFLHTLRIEPSDVFCVFVSFQYVNSTCCFRAKQCHLESLICRYSRCQAIRESSNIR